MNELHGYCDDDGNSLCPICHIIMESHGCTGYTNIRNIPVETEASWLKCPNCGLICDD